MNVAYALGWILFLYLGGAGVYELLGGRRRRALVLLLGSAAWMIAMFVILHFAAKSFFFAWMLGYLLVAGLVARATHLALGKPDL